MSWEEELEKAKVKGLPKSKPFRNVKDDYIVTTNNQKWIEKNIKHLLEIEDDKDKKSE